MLGLDMMLKSMGIDPKEVKEQVAQLVSDVQSHKMEMERQGRLLDAIARKLEINPRDFDAQTVKEINHV